LGFLRLFDANEARILLQFERSPIGAVPGLECPQRRDIEAVRQLFRYRPGKHKVHHLRI
jgi:hypothetical protein